jgi:hypothetical protein
MSEKKFRPILCIDFDGVIHSYDKGWQNGEIYGELTPGFVEWAQKAGEIFDLCVYSSRSSSVEGIAKMASWFDAKLPEDVNFKLRFVAEKPPAYLTIDDRAITFKGDWSAEELVPANMLAFKPWNVKS